MSEEGVTVTDTNSGIEVEGTWEEICNFFTELEPSIGEHIDGDEAERLDNWSPEEEDGRKEMKRKTAEDASMNKRSLEKKCGEKKEEIKEGSKEIVKSVKDAKNRDGGKEELANGAKKVARAVGTKSLGSMREAEKKIYEKVMLALNPYYFDSEDVSINLRSEDSGEYSMKVNVTDEDLKEDLQNNLTNDD